MCNLRLLTHMYFRLILPSPVSWYSTAPEKKQNYMCKEPATFKTHVLEINSTHPWMPSEARLGPPSYITERRFSATDIRLNKASRDVRHTLEKYHGFPRLVGGGFRISGASQDI